MLKLICRKLSHFYTGSKPALDRDSVNESTSTEQTRKIENEQTRKIENEQTRKIEKRANKEDRTTVELL